MRHRFLALGLSFLFLLGSTTSCLSWFCTAPAVDFDQASEGVKIWIEECLGGNPEEAARYWSPVSAETGRIACQRMPLLRRSLVESSAVAGIDSYEYGPAKVVAVQQQSSQDCVNKLAVLLQREDGRRGRPLTFLVTNGDTGPDNVVLYAAEDPCVWPEAGNLADWESFVSCFWQDGGSEGLPEPDGASRVHVFRIDTQSPNLSFEMVMARDSTNVNEGQKTQSSPRERVADMVARPPYVSRNPVLAFNADYFSMNNDHGPEGLTVKNGQRFDGQFADPPDYDGPGLAADGNTNETNWSSLSISKAKGVRIGKQTDCQTHCFKWPFSNEAYYNTVGGGPLFIEGGERIGGFGSTLPCENERFTKEYCTGEPTAWTAVGVSGDGRYLIVVVGQQQTMDSIASILLAEGADRAMKLDGGGSTQLWYRGEEIIASGRAVANGIVVFSEP
jgi:hypothetical protein